MDKDDRKLKLIEKFLDGNLSPDQQVEFDQMLNEKSFRQEVMLHAKVLDQNNAMRKKALLKDIKQKASGYSTVHEVEEVYDKKSNGDEMTSRSLTERRPAYATMGKWAALILLLVMMLVTYFDDVGGIDHNELYTEYYSSMPLDSQVRSDESTAEISPGQQAYLNKQYLQVLAEFENSEALTEQDILLKSIAFMETGDFNAAYSEISTILNSTDDNIRFNANWYSALAALKVNKVDEAKRKLETIALDPSNLFYSKANSLLEKLN